MRAVYPSGIVTDIAPAQHGLAFFADNRFDLGLNGPALAALQRHEGHTDAILSLRRQFNTYLRADASKEFIGNLQQDAGPVTGIVFAAGAAAVRQIGQNSQSLTDDGGRFFSLYVDNKAFARIMSNCGS